MSAKVESVLAKLGIPFEPKAKSGFLWARCPYHEDNNPSWHIRITPYRYGQHHCFSCGSGGSIHGLVMHVRGVSHTEASNFLEALGGVDVRPEEDAPTFVVTEEMSERRFQLPAGVKFGPLDTWPSLAAKYLTKRNITAQQVDRWRLGYADSGKLAGRLVVPVWTNDAAGMHAHSYMARDYCNNGKRYLYPRGVDNPELDRMFGELRWPREKEVVIVTEGAFNALSFERCFSIPPAIAALGGRFLRDGHLERIARFKRVLVFTDNDDAGNSAAEDIARALGRHSLVTRGNLPEGVDADELPPDELLERCERALSTIH